MVRRDIYERKFMFCLFFRTRGPVLVHIAEKGMTIYNYYYIENSLSPALQFASKEH